jgi:hypothetical protein
MSDNRTFDVALQQWLDAGSDRTPAPAIDAVLLAIRTTPQERDLRILRRTPPMITPFRFAAGVAAIAILGIAAFSFSGRTLPPGNAQEPTPTIQPTAAETTSPDTTLARGPISTAGWTPYISTRYGFTISHPADWAEVPADHDWSLPADADWRSTGAEAFVGPPLRVSAWSVAVEPGVSAEDWIAAYCPLSSGPCSALRDRAVTVSLDGNRGVLHRFGSDTQSFFLIEDRMYVVAAWRPESQNYLEAFLSTIELLPAGPAEASGSR